MSWRRHGDGIVPCGDHTNEIMDNEEITFVLLAYYWLEIKKHTGENIAIASPMLRRAVREHRRWITQIIRNIITSNIHRRCLHGHAENITDVSPMSRRLSGTFLTLVYLAECSPTAVRCSARYRGWFLATKHPDKIQCLTFFSMFRCLVEAWRLLA